MRHDTPKTAAGTSLFLSMLFGLLLLVLILPGCGGPKDISSDAARVDREYYGKGGPDPMSDARYPIPGVATRKDYYFYNLSQPTVVENVQNWRMRQFNNRPGSTNSINGLNGAVPLKPAGTDVPKQRSPFRQ